MPKGEISLFRQNNPSYFLELIFSNKFEFVKSNIFAQTFALTLLIDDIPRLPTIWYSICVVLNAMSYKVRLTVNGFDLVREDSIQRLNFFALCITWQIK